MKVGIDLGTTHTVVAYAEGSAAPAILPVAQLVARGERAPRSLLPSFLYAPAEGESAEAPLRLELPGAEGSWIAGEHARARGAEVPARLVSSAKSWLSYARVDRRAAILPWQLAGDPGESAESAERVPRISPVSASALLLEHVRRCWEAAFPRAPLAEQELVLTVPASFDAVARELTVEAARALGLSPRLLEEPQAAFYDLMRAGGDAALDRVLAGDEQALVLVCDIGGGTTDLSLIRVRRSAGGGIEVDRVAVGKHLLLGGDNMDLALAHRVEPRLLAPGAERLDPHRFAQLVARCRAAKERLLADDPPEAVPIAVVGRGSQLVGGARRAELRREEVEQVVLDGFFPELDRAEAARAAPARGGFVAFGLPYEREVAVTRHLARFVERHADEGPVRALLLNGGVFRAPALVRRMRATLERWTEGRALLLEHTDPDTSVALGAVRYAQALGGAARRIGGGAAKSYYLGVEAAGGGPQALCVLPKGAEEGRIHRAEAHPLEVTVGRKVRFDLYASERADAVDSLLPVGDAHDRLAPLVTTLAARGDERALSVVLEAELSAIGTLELACVEARPHAERPRRFALAFDLRAAEEGDRPAHEAASAEARWGKRLEQARESIEAIYGKKGRKQVAERDVKGLFRALEKIFGKRDGWDAILTRTLFDVMWRHHRGRRTSAEHERMFWMLAGFCLRPGVGHARDDERAAGLYQLFDQRLAHSSERGWQQFWIAWRRVAAGLDQPSQEHIRDVIDPFLAPAERGLKKPKPFKNDAVWEMLDLAVSLERVAPERRGELGGWIIERTWTERDPRLWAALGKVGARVPTYASAHHVVSARTVERWVDHLLREKWERIPSAPRAAVRLGRVTGDRARDLAETTRIKLAERLAKIGVPDAHIAPLRELVAIDDAERADFYGEGLPAGLRLAR